MCLPKIDDLVTPGSPIANFAVESTIDILAKQLAIDPAELRTEHDALGALEIPADALHGIHTARAIANRAILLPDDKLEDAVLEAIDNLWSGADQLPDSDKILRSLKEGKVDILIGTHRLIQKDVSFRDLGLVIIDEVQISAAWAAGTWANCQSSFSPGATLMRSPAARTSATFLGEVAIGKNLIIHFSD